MAQTENDEEPLSQNQPNVNTISELPQRPYTPMMEVPLFLAMMGVTLCGPIISNIILYRTCVHALNHTREECHVFLAPSRSNTSKELEAEVQAYTTYISIVKTFIESIGPAIISLFIGVWSDTYGRKPLIVWPLFGMSMSSLLFVVYTLMDNLGPWWVLLTVVPITFSGGYSALFTGTFTYISDVTNTENRSFRMTVLEVAVSAGTFTGSLISSYLIRAIGNLYVLVINVVLYVMAYAFTTIWVKESLNGALSGGICSLLDIRLVKEMMTTCFRRRPNHGRAVIFLLTMSNTLIIFILYGTMSLSYLYTREKLQWAVHEYSIFSSVNTLIAVIGAMFGVHVGGKLLKISDLSLAIVGYGSTVIQFVITAFATTSWHMYLGSGISLFKDLSPPLIRSHITKALPVEDIAKVFAFLCALEAICPMFAPLIYNSLYRYTLLTFPGAIYILSAFITTVCTIMLGVVQYFSYKHASSYEIMRVAE